MVRSVLARFWLLTLLLMLLVQGGGGWSASAGQLVEATASYLPQDAPGSERQRVDENATVEVDDDDASRDGDVGVEVCEFLQALSKPVVGTPLLRSWRYRRPEGGLDLLLFLRAALPLRGPPSPGLWRGPVRT